MPASAHKALSLEGKPLSEAMPLAQFTACARDLARAAGVLETHHAYFNIHCERLYTTCLRFGLFTRPLGSVLEIGPYYSYTPFLLRPNAAAYVVLEGDDPSSDPLRPLYEQHQVGVHFLDLFELFGPTREAPHARPFRTAALTRCCAGKRWSTSTSTRLSSRASCIGCSAPVAGHASRCPTGPQCKT